MSNELTKADLFTLNIRAAKRMGWKKWTDEELGILTGDWSGVIWTPPDKHELGHACDAPPNYIGSVDAAMTLVEKLREMGWVIELRNGLDGTWECEASRPKQPDSYPDHIAIIHGQYCELYYRPADTAALAITLAALAVFDRLEEKP